MVTPNIHFLFAIPTFLVSDLSMFTLLHSVISSITSNSAFSRISGVMTFLAYGRGLGSYTGPATFFTSR